jgi:hypothetical protein
LFLVENVDFSRLEVSSPGLDRPLKSLADFARFAGSGAKVKLNSMIDKRRRFDGTIRVVVGDKIVFAVWGDGGEPSSARGAMPGSKGLKRKEKKAASQSDEVLITVPIVNVERARLIPDI